MGRVSLELSLKPIFFECPNFSPSPDVQRQTVVVIAPIKIEQQAGEVRVSWACSLGAACLFKHCTYAFRKRLLARDAAKI